ncbi:hypothetical protein ACFYE3_19010, partial [Kocuria sp. CPCC 205293]|uniref:hypothetical protein n=1 Tax=Kocuria arenosa TaxID=3071446 RepID=UPI0036DA9397
CSEKKKKEFQKGQSKFAGCRSLRREENSGWERQSKSGILGQSSRSAGVVLCEEDYFHLLGGVVGAGARQMMQ